MRNDIQPAVRLRGNGIECAGGSCALVGKGATEVISIEFDGHIEPKNRSCPRKGSRRDAAKGSNSQRHKKYEQIQYDIDFQAVTRSVSYLNRIRF